MSFASAARHETGEAVERDLPGPGDGAIRIAVGTCCAILGASIFALDVTTPTGVAWSMAYLLVVLLGWRLHRRVEVQVIAALCTVAVIAGFAFKPAGVSPAIAISNRGLGLVSIWAVAGLIVLARRSAMRFAEGRQRLAAIVENAVDAIVTIDSRGLIRSCNAATVTLLQYQPHELLGRNVSMLMPNPYHDEHDAYLAHYLATGERRIIGIGREVVAQRKDGSVFPVRLGVSEFTLGDERFFTGILSDISARREAEAAVERANRALSERNRELQNIVYVASHDLRSPLVNIQGFGRELERACGEIRELVLKDALSDADRERVRMTVDADIKESLHFILGSATKMDNLLAGLLRLSRLGRAALRFEQLDMNELVAQVARSMEFQLQTFFAQLDVGDLPSCAGDATQIGQVFSNLLDNALKYRAPDRLPVISITGVRDGACCTYHVRDNGIGIARTHQERVFEIFHRLDTSGVEGEGLGLTIAQRIVERHHGAIGLESEPGHGSTFSVTLPAERATLIAAGDS